MKYLLLLLLAGCTTPELAKGSGRPAEAPPGYVKMCLEHPELAVCPK